MRIYTAAQKHDANMFSDETAVYVLRALGVIVHFLFSALN